MSKKVDLVNNENVKKITKALFKAIPEAPSNFEVVFALRYHQVNIFYCMRDKKFTKRSFVYFINETLTSIIDEYKNK